MSNTQQTYFFVILVIISVKYAFTKPSCHTPENSDYIIDWFSCGLDSTSWYGVTKTTNTFSDSVSILFGRLICIRVINLLK